MLGITDINLMYDVSWSAISNEYMKFGMPLLVGDQDNDAAQLKTISPLVNAARIKQPLLMAYGGSDVGMPLLSEILQWVSTRPSQGARTSATTRLNHKQIEAILALPAPKRHERTRERPL